MKRGEIATLWEYFKGILIQHKTIAEDADV